jgi:hypothetical protein
MFVYVKVKINKYLNKINKFKIKMVNGHKLLLMIFFHVHQIKDSLILKHNENNFGFH